MTLFNGKNRLDESTGIGQDNSNEAMQPASETKKTPWFLRFAPGAILRQIGLAILTLTMLVGVQTAQMMASVPTIDWCPKYESKTEFSMSMLMGHQIERGDICERDRILARIL